MSRAPFLNALVPIADRGYEQIYTVTIPNVDAYQLISNAVWYTLHRLAPSYNCVFNQVDGAMCYYIGSGGIHIQLFVMRLSAHAVNLSVYPLYPNDPIEAIAWMHQYTPDRIAAMLTPVLTRCHNEIQRFLSEAAQAENFDPPRPKSSKWEDRIDWLDTYHRYKSSEEQAALLNVSPKTLENNRSRLDRQKQYRIRGNNREESGA